MGITSLSPLEAILVAICGFLTVFLMLAVLWLMIVLISKVVAKLPGAQKKPAVAAAAPAPAPAPVETPVSPPVNATFGGEVKLVGVDEKTAACIMAIVSHETNIPLDQLVFRRIKAIEEEQEK